MKKLTLLICCLIFCSIHLIAQDRVFKNVSLELKNDILLANQGVFKVHSLELNAMGDIVFFDFGENKIVKTNVNNNEFEFLGNGKGRGPKEFMQIMDIKISNGKIFLVDREKGMFIKWYINGKFDMEAKIRDRFIKPSRIALCSDSGSYFVLSSQYGPKGIFHKYNADSKLITSFNKIENRDKRMPYYTDGNITCDDSGNLFYAPRYVNSIRKYNTEGHVDFDIPVYSFKSNKKIMEKKGRWFSPAEGVRRASGDVYYLNQKLFVGFSDSKYIESKLIDVYDSKNGDYKYSIQIPQIFTEFSINDKYIIIFTLDEEGETHLKTYTYDSSLLD